jgi:hypothetical protein
MTRLASRSPAAPFQSSRPGPMPQYPPQATTTTEAQTLRQMVQQREATIEQTRVQVRAATSYLEKHEEDIPQDVRGTLNELLKAALSPDASS